MVRQIAQAINSKTLPYFVPTYYCSSEPRVGVQPALPTKKQNQKPSQNPYPSQIDEKKEKVSVQSKLALLVVAAIRKGEKKL